jgi:hypothetical protein
MRAAALLCLVAACGTTHIRTDDRRALIYVDGQLAGRGEAEMTRRGTPHTAQIVVVAPDGRRARLDVSRSFTSTTLIVGLFTDLVGLIAAWEMPESVYVPLAQGPSWDDVGTSW